MATARTSRPPTGRVNTPLPVQLDSNRSSRANSARSRPLTSGGFANTLPSTSRDVKASALITDRSDLSTNEVLRRLKDKLNEPNKLRHTAEFESLGSYNAFSRPRASSTTALRSVLLDPEVNNFAPSRTRSELMKKIKLSGTPHPSYDLDLDGYVSQEDYKLAKRFDLDASGILDANERRVGQIVLAEEFFQKNKDNLNYFGPQIAKNSIKQNVDQLVNSHCFERTYEKLLAAERRLKAETSEPIFSCMKFTGGEHILKHNFYTNKFDTTAWNDHEAIPRSASQFGPEDHGGSRKRLLFARKETMRLDNQSKLDKVLDSRPTPSTRRVHLITNISIENS